MAEIPLYCHSCHHQWQQQRAHDIECPACPACGSASTEIVNPDDDPRHFYARQPTEVVPPPPSSETTAARDAPERTHGGHPGNDTQGTGASPNPGQNPNPGDATRPRPDFVFMFPQPAVTFFTTIVTNHVPPPNAAGPSGPPVAYFGLNFFGPQLQSMPTAPPPTQANSPPSGVDSANYQDRQPGEQQPHPDASQHGGHPNGPAPVHLPFLSSLLASIFSVNPANAAFGDAVFSQEALDRIISQLREVNGPGGAPPASQTAIDKLEVRELDETMLGDDGTKSTRCVICVDEMALGSKASVLPCNHFFHGECVTPWLKQHNTCPVCRRPIEEEVVKPAKATFAEDHAVHEQTAQDAPETTGCS